ncbi:MAG: transcription termination/antitermination factor NusG [Clostridia bacterium]|nr:transcription termination/antitermination factor NusG [Oscillospiraceae bacterium]MBR2474462.1 transcription termination/antitermination factor NusG [Clostridia bacterium]
MSDFNDAIPEIRWYVVHTFTGYENKVKANLEKIIENRELQDEIVDVVVPVEIRMDGDKEYEAKLMPSYVLVKMLMNDANWHVVRNITGVTGFVGPGSKPVPLTDEEVSRMGIEVSVVTLDYEVGDSVKIIDGPLANYSGVVQSISDDKKTVTVLASMFGRSTPVDLKSNQIERII